MKPLSKIDHQDSMIIHPAKNSIVEIRDFTIKWGTVKMYKSLQTFFRKGQQ